MRFPEPGSRAWMNGRWLSCEEAVLPMHDPGLQAGLGVFETLAIRFGRPLEANQHLDRLEAHARHLGVPLPAREDLEHALREFSAGLPGGYGWLEVVATRSGHCAVFGGRMEASEEGRPASAVLLRWRRCPSDPLAGIKSLNYAHNVLGLEEAQRRGADEGLGLNSRGHLAEGCSSNLFIVRHRKVYTPSTREGVLAGIVRSLAIQAVRRLGLALHEGKVRLSRLQHADEAFLTSSSRGVRPLVEFDGKAIGQGRPGPITSSIMAEVHRLRYASVEPIPASGFSGAEGE